MVTKAAIKPKYHNKLAKFMQSVEKRTNITDVFVSPSFHLEYINSGSTVMNMLIGGSRLKDGSFVCPGYPKGTIIEIFGRESSGKSTLALTAMGQVCAEGGSGLYVDLECAVKDNYAIKLGCDFRSPDSGGDGSAVRVQPHSFEETEQLVTMAALQGIELIVIDSVAGLVSTREVKRDVTKDSVAVAEIPRLMSQWMPKLQSVMAKTGTTCIFLNQTRDKIGAMGYNEEVVKSTTGGNALKFWAAIRMLLSPKTSMKAKVFNPITKEKEDVQIATDIRVKMVKNKIDAKQGHVGMITLRYGVGIDELLTMLNVALAYDIVIKSKNSKKQDIYKFQSPGSGRTIEAVGLEKFRLMMQGDPESLQDMMKLAQDQIVSGYRIIDDEQLAALAEGSVTYKEDSDDDYEEGEGPKVTDMGEVDYSDLADGEEDDDDGNVSSLDLDV